MKLYIDDTDYPISTRDKARVKRLSKFFYHRRFEYSIFVYTNGRVSYYTDKHQSHCLFEPKGKVKIWLHNHPNCVGWPSLMDRIIARDSGVEIAGVYGRNQVKNRLEVYVYSNRV